MHASCNRRWHRSWWAGLGALCLLAGCSGSPSADQQATATIEGLGGKAVHKDGYVVHVDLSHVDSKDDDLAALAKLTRLEKVYLGRSTTDAGLVHLRGLTSLRSLDMQNTQITDAGLESLSGLTGLVQIYTHGSKITEAGVQSLKQRLPKLIVETFPIDRRGK